MSLVPTRIGFKSRQQEDTQLLAKFLSTTGPEEYQKKAYPTSRLFNRLRRKRVEKEVEKSSVDLYSEFPLPPTHLPAHALCSHCHQRLHIRARRASSPASWPPENHRLPQNRPWTPCRVVLEPGENLVSLWVS
ncbi:hypothetical protein BY458DRAFT_512424 [Sporodiniella umbellata]|nr:hypothetical protein BY458DRAFT_512424 [Sporodiniella umbellata]